MEMALWSIMMQTDSITKLILVIMLGMSIVCWSIFFYKTIIFRSKMKQFVQAQQLLQKVTTFDDLLSKSALLRDTVPGILIAQYLSEFKNVLKTHDGIRVLSAREWDVFHTHVSLIIEEAMSQEESVLPVLSTSAAAAPLIGLFGTVWGLIHAFMGISTQKSADIAAVAPGIAEALITTLGGLVVAIPALVMFSYVRSQAKKLEQMVISLSEKSIAIMKMSTSDTPVIFAEKSAPIKTAVMKESGL
jgi:biopolymer transport protein TolQ